MSTNFDYTSQTHNTLLENNGKRITLNGKSGTLQTSTYNASYPYERPVITAYFQPDKNTESYRAIKRQLGDDWATDILESDVEVLSEVLVQLEE